MLEHNKKLIFIRAVYMPQQRCTIADFQVHLDMLEHIVKQCLSLIVGDWNAYFGDGTGQRALGKTTPNEAKVMGMIEICSLAVIDLDSKYTGPKFTYQGETPSNATSYIVYRLRYCLESSCKCCTDNLCVGG